MGGIKKIMRSKSKTFLAFCFAFLFGVGAGSFISVDISFVFLYTSVFVFASLFILTWQSRVWRFVVLLLLCFLFGVVRYQFSFPMGDNYVAGLTGKHTIVGVVDAEPDIRTDGVRYIVEAQGDLKGRVYLKNKLYPRYEYGDTLRLKCFLNIPEPIEDFRYDMYLARYGVFSVCANPFIEKIEEGSGNVILRGIFQTKNIVAKKINILWHEPMASFMAGLLYGYRGGLGSLNELFSRTGVTHIIAISGYNITIIATILITICIHAYIPRKKAFWVVSIGIVLFVIFAGGSASVVRAGVMGMIVLLGKRLGRGSSIFPTMILTAVLMTLHNPFILLWDAGFQLSFIATLGLVYLTPVIEKPVRKLPEIFGIKESLVSTLAAIIATLPLILFQFGRLSLVAPIVNMLILWIIPWIMIIGFFSVMMSFLFMPLAHVLAWIALIGMKFIVFVVSFFASLPFAAVDVRVPWWGMVVGYLVIWWWVYKSSNITK
jgi:competence protein ComEC